MPFIRGRYHINPIMGEALEAARDAEAALLALKQKSRRNGGAATGYDSNIQSADDSDDQTSDNANARAIAPKGLIHRVEIEAAEMVPSHSGRGQRGYAMRLHRLPPQNGDASSDSDDDADSSANSYSGASGMPSRNASSTGGNRTRTFFRITTICSIFSAKNWPMIRPTGNVVPARTQNRPSLLLRMSHF
jgi:hypothetical protein